MIDYNNTLNIQQSLMKSQQEDSAILSCEMISKSTLIDLKNLQKPFCPGGFESRISVLILTVNYLLKKMNGSNKKSKIHLFVQTIDVTLVSILMIKINRKIKNH